MLRGKEGTALGGIVTLPPMRVEQKSPVRKDDQGPCETVIKKQAAPRLQPRKWNVLGGVDRPLYIVTPVAEVIGSRRGLPISVAEAL